ncbi:hypothetical protein QUF58_14940, partial [Anaerolineales bacterium HSG24]|nr:hypothetical protein [Anaerolineales bacterium HSG24]
MKFGLILIAVCWASSYLLARRYITPKPDGSFQTVRFLLPEIIAASGLLALLTVGFFWQILLTEAWMPAGGGDLAPYLYPNYRFAAEHLKQGTLPLWNPHLYSGTPFAADIQSGLFYPINLLVFLLVPDLSYEWMEYLAVFHFWTADMSQVDWQKIYKRYQKLLDRVATRTEFSDLVWEMQGE